MKILKSPSAGNRLQRANYHCLWIKVASYRLQVNLPESDEGGPGRVNQGIINKNGNYATLFIPKTCINRFTIGICLAGNIK